VYAVIVLSVVLAAWFKGSRKFTRREEVLAGILAGGSIIALWASYSRSAALAALAAIGILLAIVYGKKISKTVWLSIGIAGLVLLGSIAIFKDTQFVSQVILHEDPYEGNDTNSNDGHAESLIDGTRRMATQPLGAGIGSTGSASLLTDEPNIIESQYLFVAHETGWLGLALYLVINYIVLRRLWLRRAQWLALGLCASGVGLAIAAFFLPVWADDTVSIIWWGLAALALAVPLAVKKKAKKS
jgi:drug/metabolite transporter (DMT)-like permease